MPRFGWHLVVAAAFFIPLGQVTTANASPSKPRDASPSVQVASSPAERAAAVSGNASPSITAPSSAEGAEGEIVTLTAQVSDPDAGQTLSIAVAGAPYFLSLSGSAGASPLTATLAGVSCQPEWDKVKA